MADATTRLAEPLGALSLATDLAVDLPSESALAATVLAVRIGEMCGMSAGVPRLHGDRRRGGIHGVG